jgi:hypothetical protein
MGSNFYGRGLPDELIAGQREVNEANEVAMKFFPRAAVRPLTIGRGNDPANNGAPYVFIESANGTFARFYGERREEFADLFLRAMAAEHWIE